jgi:hypothetical protein
MHTVPEETSGDESGAHDDEAEGQGFLFHYSTAVGVFTATFFATIIISILISRMWNEDEIKLHVLDALMRLFQAIARLSGGWALECERTYNEYVNALH